MITKTFIAKFTGQLSKIEHLSFRPPIRVEQGHSYVIRINQISGHTDWHEVYPQVPLEPSEKLFGRIA
ncbi:MAG: hypothetical protein Q7R68_11100 [Nitrospirales bacterium]|nr:hypothetical protein [Nitrospirales bacterium]